MWRYVLLASVLVLGVVIVVALLFSWTSSREAQDRFADLEKAAAAPPERFDVSMLEGLPEVARRYFVHAIASGTPLRTTVRLRMEGEFLLGDASKFQTYSMTAQQILSPPDEFVWVPSMRSGIIEISGSDALVDGGAWTRFWMNGLVPVVNQSGTPDLVRSALSRSAMEAIWAPASLLPQNGLTWEQTGPDSARLTFPTGIEPVDLRLGPDGAVLQVATMRWSNVNPDAQFRLQPFGGTVEGERTFAGYTIPSKVRMGNHFGTEDYLPFFQAELVDVRYPPD
jgi:hypothetical protein